MAKLRGVDLDIDLVNGELSIELPDGHRLGFAARADVGDVIIALEQHYAQHVGTLTNAPWGVGTTSGSRYPAPQAAGQPIHISVRSVNMPPDAVDAAAQHAVEGRTGAPQPSTCWWCDTSNAPGTQRCQQCGKEIG